MSRSPSPSSPVAVPGWGMQFLVPAHRMFNGGTLNSARRVKDDVPAVQLAASSHTCSRCAPSSTWT